MKHSYQTRRLLATRDMRHDGQHVVAGGEVFATETDANYLIRNGHAREPQDAPAPTTALAASPPRRGPGRPAKVELAARAPAPSTDKTPQSAPAAAMTMANFAGTPSPDVASNEAPGTGAGETGSDAAG